MYFHNPSQFNSNANERIKALTKALAMLGNAQMTHEAYGRQAILALCSSIENALVALEPAVEDDWD